MSIYLNTRYLNTLVIPLPGQVWTFDDRSKEGRKIEWKIEAIRPSVTTPRLLVQIRKLTGKDVGYRTNVDAFRLRGPRWAFSDGPVERVEVLWNCPGCDQPRGIPTGDYVCEYCRDCAS